MKLWKFFVAVTAVAAITLLSAGVVGLTHTAQAQTATPTDYDTDDDGLIEVGSLAQLDAIRYDLDGDGSPTDSTAYDAAFPNAATGMGCPSTGCTGYELTTNLDFDTNGNGEADAGDDYWNDGAGWEPIGTGNVPFTVTFEGSGNTISSMFINRPSAWRIALFGEVSNTGTVRNVGLTDVDVTGGTAVGGLVGVSEGAITASYVEGRIEGGATVGGLVGKNAGVITASHVEGQVEGGITLTGGLVGENNGTITASYAAGTVSGGSDVGGLVGWNNGATISASYAAVTVSGSGRVGGLVGENLATILACYAIGTVSGNDAVGGLVGYNLGTISASYATGPTSGPRRVGGLAGRNRGDMREGTAIASYWDTETSGQSTSAGGVGKTTSELQSPTGYTGIYADWNVVLDGDGTGDDPWDFGTSSDYPVIGNDPTATGTPVSSPGAPTIGVVTPGTGTLAITWTAPSSDGGSAITAYDLRHIETSADETVDSNWTVVDDVWTTGGGTFQYTLTGLTGGTQYDLQIRAVNAAGDGLWSATATGTPTAAAATSPIDYDTDDDGLIEVGSLAQLDAIRYDLDGDGSPTDSTAYDAAFPNAATGMGCPSTGCTGYELTTNLDFDTNGNGEADAGDDYWNGGAGWEPIGTLTATFEGNDNIISGLFINRLSLGVGLFSYVNSTGTIRNVSLTGVDVTGHGEVGGLAGSNRGTITASHAEGEVNGERDVIGGLVGRNDGTITASYAVATVSSSRRYAGGLVGRNGGTITASYATGTVSGENHVGGLAGENGGTGTIAASYATGTVSGDSFVAGLVGSNAAYGGTPPGGSFILSGTGTITASYATGTVSGGSNVGGLVGDSYKGAGITTSYWDTRTSGQSTSDGGVGKTTSELQSPIGYTGIYADWNVDLDGDGTNDDPWDFGTNSEYPVIDYVPSAPAMSLGAPTIGTVTPGAGSLAISWTAPSSDGGSAVTAYDLRHIETSADETVDSNWTVVDDVWTTGGGTLQYTLTGLTGGTQYDLQIRAVNAGGDGPWSATATGTPTTDTSASAGLTDREILVALYNATDGDNWERKRLWLTDAPLGEWHGVSTDTEGRVTQLHLNLNQLNGEIPTELGNLANLQGLSLGGNPQLTGEIPTELGNLANLQGLSLDSNRLTGEIPEELGNLANLQELRLTENQLTGEIPTELGNLANLQRLYLDINPLTGEIPEELGNLASLQTLRLTNNQLIGKIPTELGNLSSLQWLFLDRNQLIGEIPEELGNLSSLRRLSLDRNQLIGEIPTELGNLSNLQWLSFDRNQLTGEIPTELGNLSNLQWLSLNRNQLTGEIPTELGNLANLRELSLSENQLTGELPGELGNLANLEVLNLHLNLLSGEIPTELGNLSNLQRLFLSRNQLTGSIPTELGNLSNLQLLTLSENELTGELPQSLTGLMALAGFYFESNSGVCAPIDQAFQIWLQSLSTVRGSSCAPTDSAEDRAVLIELYDATDGANWTNNTNWLSDRSVREWYGVTNDAHGRVNGLYLYSNQLSGSIPAALGSLSNLQSLFLTDNQLTGEIPKELDNLSNLQRLFLRGNQITGCIPQGLGSVRINDLDQLGLSPCSGSASSLGAPTIGTVTPGTGSLAITWTVPSSDGGSAITAYDLRHIETSADETVDSNWTVVDDVWATGGGTLQYTLTGLTGGTQYDLQVRAVNAGGDGPWSATATGTPTTDTDRDILVALYNATDGANWTDNTSWLSDEPLGNWHGVDTDPNGRVTGLSLGYNNGLTGTIPAELGNLSNLERLSLGRNYLTGAIPSQLGSLSNLETLWLGDNQLTGAIPAELGSLSNLEYLGIEGNGLAEAIPAELGNLSSLTWLALNGNQLTGALPQSFTNLTALDDFAFSDNAGLCAPTDAAFQTWLQGISNSNMTIEVAMPYGPNCISSELTDREILTALYNATGGANWTDNTNWLSDEPLDDWHGVTTNADGGVTKLDLTKNRLSGRMPSHLGDLSSLSELRLANNHLSGPIPSELGKLSSLTRLDLENNDLSGAIPSQLGGLSDLRVLLLGDNNLDGHLPAQLGNLGRLSYMRIRNNDLTGPIPPELGRLENLTHLYANNNDLVGSIPSELGNLSNLRFLFLNNNDLSGSIPAALGQLDKLAYLWLNHNDLTGPIPGELGGLPNLVRLYVNHNNLSGAIPRGLGGLDKLELLYVHRNNLSGTIPRELGGMANLKRLYAYDNDLSGAIPIELGRFANLERLHIAQNNLSGSIPSELGDIANLTHLILSENDLTGGIPPSLGGLSNLQVLYLYNNELSGAIPAELGDLSDLIQLYLGNNYFEGCIPAKLRGVPSNDLDSLGLSDCGGR